MADLAALVVSLELQQASFERGMQQANASMARMEANAKKTSGGISSIANGLKNMVTGAGIAGIIAMAKSLAEAADAAADTAQAFGTTIDKIYAYNQAALEAGGKTDGLQNGLQKLADTVDSAFAGTDSAVEAFARLGISMDSIKNQSLDKIFERVAQALEKETDEVKRNALAKDLLGKSMIGIDYATFNRGVAEASPRMKELAPLLMEAADGADALAAAWNRLKTELTAAFGGVVKTVRDLGQGFSDLYAVVTGNKSIADAMKLPEVADSAERAAPAIERVAKATGAQVKAATEAAKEMEKWNAVIAKGVVDQFEWTEKLKDSINPMREIDRELAKLDKAMSLGWLTQEQYADGFFKITDAASNFGTKAKEELDPINIAIGQSLATGISGVIDSFDKAGQSFGEFAASFLKNIAKMIAQAYILKAIGSTSWGQSLGIKANANGDSFPGGTGLPHGIYTSPTFFKFANGGVFGSRTGVLAEVPGSAEAIVPLKRHGNKLGVTASPVNVNVINQNNSDVEVQSSESQDGSKTIDIIIKQKLQEAFSSGSMDKSMSLNYGLRRRGI